jgi:hypothetical protein
MASAQAIGAPRHETGTVADRFRAVRLVRHAWPQSRAVEVKRAPGRFRRLAAAALMHGGARLPRFSVPVDALSPQGRGADAGKKIEEAQSPWRPRSKRA